MPPKMGPRPPTGNPGSAPGNQFEWQDKISHRANLKLSVL